jgi:hypothetical protein
MVKLLEYTKKRQQNDIEAAQALWQEYKRRKRGK